MPQAEGLVFVVDGSVDVSAVKQDLAVHLNGKPELEGVRAEQILVSVSAGSVVLGVTLVLEAAEVEVAQAELSSLLMGGTASRVLGVDVISYTMPEASPVPPAGLALARLQCPLPSDGRGECRRSSGGASSWAFRECRPLAAQPACSGRGWISSVCD